jgi:hypothetical protein
MQTDRHLPGRTDLVSTAKMRRVATDSDAEPRRRRRVTGRVKDSRRIGLQRLCSHGLAAVQMDIVDDDGIDAFSSYVHAEHDWGFRRTKQSLYVPTGSSEPAGCRDLNAKWSGRRNHA